MGRGVRRFAAVFLGLTTACGGGASSPDGATSSGTAPAGGIRPDVLYIGGSGGFWGFSIGTDGLLTPVASSPIVAGYPFFTADGTKAATREGDSIVVYPVPSSGRFGVAESRFPAADSFRDAPGSRPWTAQWSPSGAMLTFSGGGNFLVDPNNPRPTSAQVIALHHSGGSLIPVQGSPAGGGTTARPALFASESLLVVRYWGSRIGSIQLPGQLLVYAVSSAGIRVVQVLDERNSGTEDGTPYLLPDSRTIITGDISLLVDGGSLRSLGRLQKLGSESILRSVVPLFDRFVLLDAASSSGGQILATFRVGEDGGFARLSTEASGEFASMLGPPMRHGRVAVLIPSDDVGSFGSAVVDSSGQLGPMRASTWRQVRGRDSYSCASDLSQTYLYCTGATSGALLSVRVGDDGSLTPFNPWNGGASPAPLTGPLVHRP